jgi:hypothetical protein
MAVNLEDIVDEILVNSLIVLPAGQGVEAQDVKITLRKQQ